MSNISSTDRPGWLAPERWILAVLLFALATAITLTGVAARLDNLIFDFGQRLHVSAPPDDILIVAIDQQSLQEYGHWPWPRTRHAEIIDRICAAKPLALGLDIAFSEPTTRADDDNLTRAITNCDRVVLPLVIESPHASGQLIENSPIATIAQAAAGIGRVGVTLDADGICRAVHLREGMGAAVWPLFAEEMIRVAKGQSHDIAVRPKENEARLVRTDQRRLQYIGPPNSISYVSFADALEHLPPDIFAGKYVIVGATALGLGDFLPTPVSGNTVPMPGVEIQANILHNLLHDKFVKELSLWQSTIVCGLLSLLPLLWLPRLMPFAGFVATLCWTGVLYLATALLPVFTNIWFEPSGLLIAGLSASPLWNLYRLRLARRHLDRELAALLGPSFFNNSTKDQGLFPRLSFEKRISLVQSAQAKMEELEKQRNDALAFISHDLRVPLAIAVQRLENPPSEQPPEVLPLLRRSLFMAQDFLQLAQAENLEPASMVPLDVLTIAYQAIDDLYDSAVARQLQLRTHLPENPVWVVGNFSSLERVFTNLLKNALTYAPETSLVEVGLESESGHAIFWVANPGDIPPDAREHLFQRFSQNLHAGTTRASTSSGLGLYYVRTVAEKHSGSVDVESKDGILKFRFRIPLESHE